MKKHITQLSLLSLVLMVGCTTNSNNAVREDNVKCEPYVSEIELQDPISIFEKDNYLYISNFKTSDYLVSIVETKECKLIGGVLMQGRGPLEAMPPVSIHAYQDDIIFHSRGAGKIFASDKREPTDIRRVYSFKKYADQCIMTSDTTMIISGNFNDSRFQEINIKSDSVVNAFGEYPSFWSEEKNIPNSVKGIFHQTRFLSNKNLLAAITGHTIEFYELQNKETPKLVKQILLDQYSYAYSVDPKFLYAELDENTTYGVMAITGDEQFIYLLFDNTKSATKGGVRHIKVYDWNGENIRNIQPDIDLTHICIDSQGEFIYGLTKQEIVRIIRFRV